MNKIGPKEQAIRQLKEKKASTTSASAKKGWVSRKKQQAVRLQRLIKNREKQG